MTVLNFCLDFSCPATRELTVEMVLVRGVTTQIQEGANHEASEHVGYSELEYTNFYTSDSTASSEPCFPPYISTTTHRSGFFLKRSASKFHECEPGHNSAGQPELDVIQVRRTAN